jgi:DNA-binding transcriptional LysR family regulator
MTTILERTAGLLAFVRTVDAGSFAGAARSIGASPSAVSKSVARLEQRLGVRLLQRSTRTLSPTSEGAAYYEHVAPHLRAIEEADDIVQVPSNVRGVLRITVPSTFGRPLISAWAGSFLERYPDIKLDLSVTDRRVDLIREGFDLAVRIGELEDTNLIGRSLGVLQFWAHRQNTFSAGESPSRSTISSSMLVFANCLAAGRKLSLLRTARGSYRMDPSIATMLNR